MSEFGYKRHISKVESGFLTNAFSSAAQEQQQSPAMNAKTLMQKIQPAKSYNVDAVNVSGLKNSVRHANTGGDQMRQVTGAMKGQVKAAQADLKQDYMAAKQEAVDMIEEVAQEQGFEMRNVMATLAPDPTASNLTFLAAAGVDLVAMGAGTMAQAAMGGAGILHDIAGESKKLKPDEMQSLMEETARRLQASSQENSELTSFPGQSLGKDSGADWSEVNGGDIQELVQGSVEDLPEMQALENLDFALDQAEQIQGLNDMMETTDYDGSKIAAALERGDERLVEVFKEADADGKITSDEFETLRNQVVDHILEDDIVTVDEINMYVDTLYDLSGNLRGVELAKVSIGARDLVQETLPEAALQLSQGMAGPKQ